MRFFQKFWHSNKTNRRSAFGGEVKSDAEIRALNKRILDHEKQELKTAEASLEEAIKDL